MNIVYFGSPQLSKELLERLVNQGLTIKFIVTQPDKASGKRLEVTSTPVKNYALSHHIDYFDKPLKDNEGDLLEMLKSKDIELGILFAYGEILSRKLLTSLKHGIWNIHPSLLPKYRGPAPIVYPLLAGDVETGSTLMQMNEKLDEGDILIQRSIPIRASIKRPELENELVDLAAQEIVDALSLLKTNMLRSKQQDSSFATYTKLLKKDDGFISKEFLSQALNNKNITFEQLPRIIQQYFSKNGIVGNKSYNAGLILYHLWQGLDPWPGVWTIINVGGKEKRLKIIEIKFQNKNLQLETVQLEGKNPVNFYIFKRAYNKFI